MCMVLHSFNYDGTHFINNFSVGIQMRRNYIWEQCHVAELSRYVYTLFWNDRQLTPGKNDVSIVFIMRFRNRLFNGPTTSTYYGSKMPTKVMLIIKPEP